MVKQAKFHDDRNRAYLANLDQAENSTIEPILIGETELLAAVGSV